MPPIVVPPWQPPHVTGTLALLKQAYPTLNAVDLRNKLIENIKIDLGTIGRDNRYGFGLTNSDWIGEESPTPSPSPTPIPKLVEKITVASATGAISVKVNKTLQMVAIVSPDDADNKTVKWSVSNTRYATINSTTGLLTGKRSGSFTVYATAQDGSSVRGSITIKVVR